MQPPFGVLDAAAVHSDVQASGFFLCWTSLFFSIPYHCFIHFLGRRASSSSPRIAPVQTFSSAYTSSPYSSLCSNMRLFLPFVFGQKRPIGLALAWEEGVHVCKTGDHVSDFLAFKRFGESVHGKEGRDGGMIRLLMHGSQRVRFEWGL